MANIIAGLLAVTLTACGESDDATSARAPSDNATGGTQATATALATGGDTVSATGGTANATGGDRATGGALATGGAATGGMRATGGNATTGGASYADCNALYRAELYCHDTTEWNGCLPGWSCALFPATPYMSGPCVFKEKSLCQPS